MLHFYMQDSIISGAIKKCLYVRNQCSSYELGMDGGLCLLYKLSESKGRKICVFKASLFYVASLSLSHLQLHSETIVKKEKKEK